jgi:hypothetical protein
VQDKKPQSEQSPEWLAEYRQGRGLNVVFKGMEAQEIRHGINFFSMEIINPKRSLQNWLCSKMNLAESGIIRQGDAEHLKGSHRMGNRRILLKISACNLP